MNGINAAREWGFKCIESVREQLELSPIVDKLKFVRTEL